MIDLSVVIVNYGTSDLLMRCLDSVDAACRFDPTLVVETIVVDNGSRDDSVACVQTRAVCPRLICLDRNLGFAAAVNRALLVMRGRYALLLNSDVEIEHDLLSNGVAILDDQPSAGILGAALKHPDGHPQRSVHAWPDLTSELLPDWILRFFRPGSGRLSNGSSASAAAGGTREVEAVRGAVFFIRGKLLEKVGLLDEGYFFFLEDTDYCWRASRAGHRVLHCPSLRATHQLGASSKARSGLATRIEFHRSLYRFLALRSGHVVSTLARVARVFRTTLSLPVLSIAAITSRDARRRLAERSGLWLWHLRGRPATAGLERALQVAERGPIRRSGL